MRLPNGYGSCYKLSGNRRRPWIARKTIGWDDEDKQQYYTIGYYETRQKALSALAEYNKNPIGDRRDVRLKDIFKEWSKVKFEKIAKDTIDGYNTAWKHLEPIHDLLVRDIRKTEIQKIIDSMHKNGFSKSSYSKVKSLVSVLLKYAMEDDIVDKNYAEFVELPKAEKKEKEIFTDMEIKKLEEMSKIDKWANTVLIMIYTGMRIGELLTLTKFDVDIENMVITGGIKTDAGKNRIIPVHPKIQKHIKYWYDNSSDILINNEGLKMSVGNYRRRYYYNVLEQAGIRKLTPHSTRHTFASLMARAGVDTLSIQKIIGHSDYATTANIYTHINIDELKEAISKI